MREIQLECLIDGQNHSAKQLDEIQYYRHLHSLHEMKWLGATITHDGKSLSHSDIDRLLPEYAREISITMRQSYGAEGLKELFREQLQQSDQMWKKANDAPDGAPMLLAETHVTITGVSLEELNKVVNLDVIHHAYAVIHPDHNFARGDSKRLDHMETFGHYGGPTWLYAYPDQTISVPVKREADYPMLMAGHTALASDGTPMNLYAYHQFKPLDNGFSVKQCAIFPPATPKPIVEGHKLHLAIEIWEAAKLAAAN